MKLPKVLTHWRIIMLIIFLVLAVVAINPRPWYTGVSIKAVSEDSLAENAGMQNPVDISQINLERIVEINNVEIKDLDNYYFELGKIGIFDTLLKIKTNQNTYFIDITNITRENDTLIDLGLSVSDVETTNIVKGLDLQGGTRVLLKPQEKVSDEDMDLVIENMQQRLNVYGLANVVVRKSTDLPPPLGSGNQYILVELAGTNEEQVKNLLAEQGNFEAKIGDKTVFNGGEKDIAYVCRSADCAGIDPYSGCGQVSEGQWACRFRFSVTLSEAAANRQADITKDLEIIIENGEEYLSEKLDLYLDGENVSSLYVGADLKGRAVTEIQISGSGSGTTQAEAITNSLEEMKRMQTLLVTGSLPVKLDIVKTDNISPSLGKQFLQNAFVIALVSILSVSLVVFLRFRKIKIVIPIIITMLSEMLILLGFAALSKWNLDLAAIAGLIVAVGTGVDDQIIITDETIKGEESKTSWKQRIEKAFFIIFAAYFTTVVAMIPLVTAGAGLLRGFALTTIVGVTIGVFITRPAFAVMIEHFLKGKEE